MSTNYFLIFYYVEQDLNRMTHIYKRHILIEISNNLPCTLYSTLSLLLFCEHKILNLFYTQKKLDLNKLFPKKHIHILPFYKSTLRKKSKNIKLLNYYVSLKAVLLILC